ncbi:MAG: c-type cytochrome [Flavobacteriales bacterium]|nr:c-type cytochrome [Flavobacteriales bacterium]
MRRVARWLVVVALVAVGAAVSSSDLAWAQPVEEGPPDPDAPPKNLKVLPKETPRREVTALMKTFNKALGVKCAYCHNTKDYALDEKKHKDIARSFMRMTLEMESPRSPTRTHPRCASTATCVTGARKNPC